MSLDAKQISAVAKLDRNAGGVIWYKVGEGKTRIVLHHFATVAKTKRLGNNIFIVVCRRAAFGDWRREITKVGMEWNACNIETYTGRLSATPLLLLVSHGMLAKLTDCIIEMSPTIAAIAYDEGYMFKSAKSALCKSAHRISCHIEDATIFSGSIMTASNVEDIWGQVFAINRHHVLAQTLTQFRSAYMNSYKIGVRQVFTNRKGGYARIVKQIAPFTATHFPLPTRVQSNIVIEIPATKEQLVIFARLREEYFYENTTTGVKLELKNAPALIAKCVAVSDGHLSDGSNHMRVRSSKYVHMLEAVSERILKGERVVVWCALRRTASRVLQLLQKNKYKTYLMVGGTKFDLAGWERDGQVVVATEDSGVSVNFLKDCALAIMFSINYKWLALQQAKGRTDRKDSKHSTCYYLYLQVKGSMDSAIYRTVHRSKSSEQQLIKDLNTWIHHGSTNL